MLDAEIVLKTVAGVIAEHLCSACAKLTQPSSVNIGVRLLLLILELFLAVLSFLLLTPDSALVLSATDIALQSHLSSGL